MDYIAPYLDYLSAHPYWAITLIFLIAFGEALLIIGLFVPSTAILVAAGMLVGTGNLSFWPVFTATALGAILGDQLSYWAGWLFGESLKTKWPLKNYPQLLASGEAFIRNHGGKSIALGRFVPGIKAVIPGIAGMLDMSQIYFLLVNVSSGLFWAATHIFPGMLLGQGLSLAGDLSARLLTVLLGLLLVLALAGWLLRLMAAWLSPRLDHVLGSLSAYAQTTKIPIFRAFGRAIDPTRPRIWLMILFAMLILIGGGALIGLVAAMHALGALYNIDQSLMMLMAEIRNQPADSIMVPLAMFGDARIMLVVMALMILILCLRRNWYLAVATSIVFALGNILAYVLSCNLLHANTLNHLVNSSVFHVAPNPTIAAALTFGVIAVLVSHSMSNWQRAIIFAVSGAAAIAIAYSRLYLGLAHFSDILFGLLFGLVLSAIMGIIIEMLSVRRIRAAELMGAAFFGLIVIWFAYIAPNVKHTELLYANRYYPTAISQTKWLHEEGWRFLPARRIDMSGKREEIFIAQYKGNLYNLRNVLTAGNWQPTEKWSWRGGINYLHPHAALSELLPRPALNSGLQAVLTMILPIERGETKRLVMRAYRSNFLIGNRFRSQPIYLLSLTQENLLRRNYLYALPSSQAAPLAEIKDFLESLTASHTIKLVGRHMIEDEEQLLFTEGQ